MPRFTVTLSHRAFAYLDVLVTAATAAEAEAAVTARIHAGDLPPVQGWEIRPDEDHGPQIANCQETE